VLSVKSALRVDGRVKSGGGAGVLYVAPLKEGGGEKTEQAASVRTNKLTMQRTAITLIRPTLEYRCEISALSVCSELIFCIFKV
jgi:hypothetical protein